MVKGLGDGRDPGVLKQRRGVGCEGIACAEDQSRHQLRALAAQMGDEVAPAHSRHANVRNDDVEVALLQLAQRFGAVADAHRVDPASRQEAQQRVAQSHFVVEHEDAEVAARVGGRGLRLGGADLGTRITGQRHQKRRAVAQLGFNGDAAAVLPHDAITNR